MKRILLDANVLLSFLTDRNEAQQKRAAALFHAAAERKHSLAVHSVTLMETVYVLTQLYGVDLEEAAGSLRDLLALPGLAAASALSWERVFEVWPRTISSLGDAMLAAVAAEGGYDAVATFDVALRKKLVRQGSVSYWRG
jgi:predicted nucleic acid-binding protein